MQHSCHCRAGFEATLSPLSALCARVAVLARRQAHKCDSLPATQDLAYGIALHLAEPAQGAFLTQSPTPPGPCSKAKPPLCLSSAAEAAVRPACLRFADCHHALPSCPAPLQIGSPPGVLLLAIEAAGSPHCFGSPLLSRLRCPADLAPSNMTLMKMYGDFQKNQYEEKNLRFGVREHGMGAICNGIALHSPGFIPYCATFFIFTDYMRSSIRMAALSQVGLGASMLKATGPLPGSCAPKQLEGWADNGILPGWLSIGVMTAWSLHPSVSDWLSHVRQGVQPQKKACWSLCCALASGLGYAMAQQILCPAVRYRNLIAVSTSSKSFSVS